MDRVDMFPTEKDGFLFQWEKLPPRVSLFGETAKKAGVQGAGLCLSFSELLIGSETVFGSLVTSFSTSTLNFQCTGPEHYTPNLAAPLV